MLTALKKAAELCESPEVFQRLSVSKLALLEARLAEAIGPDTPGRCFLDEDFWTRMDAKRTLRHIRAALAAGRIAAAS
jgi:hypothetical protein